MGGQAAVTRPGSQVFPTRDPAGRLSLDSRPKMGLQPLDLPLSPPGHTEGIGQEVWTMGLLFSE